MGTAQPRRANKVSGFLSTSPWFYRPAPIANPRLRLFCFPYAGGNASIFRTWAQAMPEGVEVVGIELPGRFRRFSEPLITDLDELLDRLEKELVGWTDVPFALFGHSLGGMVAFELARRLKDKPAHLFISGCNVPWLRRFDEPIHQLPDGDFIQEVARLGGIPKEVMRETELLEMIIPILRADTMIAETWSPTDRSPLPIPLTVFGGAADQDIPREDLEVWQTQTDADFALHLIEGDHFFINSSKDRLLGLIAAELESCAGSCRLAA